LSIQVESLRNKIKDDLCEILSANFEDFDPQIWEDLWEDNEPETEFFPILDRKNDNKKKIQLICKMLEKDFLPCVCSFARVNKPETTKLWKKYFQEQMTCLVTILLCEQVK
jgi:hypothetical protein